MTRTTKNFIALLLIISIIMLSKDIETISGYDLRIFLYIMGVIFGFNLIVRRNFRFKKYFLSRLNVLTEKKRYLYRYELPKELLFAKYLEIFALLDMKTVRADEENGDIFAITSMGLNSWGENIYISLKEENNNTEVKFASACWFGIFSWGRNEENHERFIMEFEESLII